VKTCAICGDSLGGKQKKFCSRKCKNRYTNYHHQSYLRQRERGRERKLQLIEMLGGVCAECGYGRNYAALEFHHTNPTRKGFQLDARALANLQWTVILEEVRKCRLLCSNCHAEHHHPDATLDPDPANIESFCSIGNSDQEMTKGSA